MDRVGRRIQNRLPQFTTIVGSRCNQSAAAPSEHRLAAEFRKILMSSLFCENGRNGLVVAMGDGVLWHPFGVRVRSTP
jgi:hypothetical protein